MYFVFCTVFPESKGPKSIYRFHAENSDNPPLCPVERELMLVSYAKMLPPNARTTGLFTHRGCDLNLHYLLNHYMYST